MWLATEDSRLEIKAATTFAFVCRFAFALDAPDALLWWEGLTSSPHARCRWFHRKLTNYRGGLEGVAAWILRTIPPKCLIEILDILVQEQRLPRSTASRMQECVLALLTAEGWK